MKLNKKLVAVNVLATLLFADVAMAKIEGVRTPGESHSSTSSAGGGKALPVKISVAKEEEGKKITSVAEANCSSDQETAKHFPLEMFKELTRDGNELKVEVKPENKKITVSIPSIINVCGRFVPEARQNDVTKNVTILMSLIGKKDGKDVSLTYKEFEDCLKEKEILVDGKIDHDKVPGKYYTESKFSMDYEFDKKKDIQKSVNVTFAYPKEFNDPKTGYSSVYGFEDNIAVPGEACMRSEKVAKNVLYINKGKDDYLKELSDICKNGSTQEIANAKNALGNYEALEGIVDQIRAEMDAGYLAKAKEEAADIYKKLTKIEDKLLSGRDTIEEVAAKKQITEYASLLQKLHELYIKPSIERLDSLILKRKAIEEKDDESPELAEIDKEIKYLNEEIGKLAKKADETGIRNLYDTMEKFATNDSARLIEEFILESELYSQYYPGKADERSPDKRSHFTELKDVQKEHVSRLQKFNQVTLGWSDVYQSGKGSTIPINRALAARTDLVTKMNKAAYDYEKNEYEKLNEYCGYGMMGGVKNPTKCKSWQEGAIGRKNAALSQRVKYANKINSQTKRIDKMGGALGMYQDRKTASEGSGGSSGGRASRYGDYNDEIIGNELTPSVITQLQAISPTAYNPQMYNMGGGQFGQTQMFNQSMIGQQQQMMYPQQQMMMQQQPQMQMQQGGWPAM